MKTIIEQYKTLNSGNAFDNIVYAKECVPNPTTDDYKTQTIERFFVRAANRDKIIEVNEDNYNKCSDFLYSKVSLYWKIAGQKESTYSADKKQIVGVEEFNTKEIIKGNQTLNGLRYKLTNPLEFYRA